MDKYLKVFENVRFSILESSFRVWKFTRDIYQKVESAYHTVQRLPSWGVTIDIVIKLIEHTWTDHAL